MILLDTHVWLWWLSDPTRLSPPAQEHIESARAQDGIHVSAISAWEAAMLVRKGRLELRLPVRDIVSACSRLPFLRFITIDPEISIAAVEIDGLHPDPADRLIAATARHEGLVLVTRDERLHAWPGLRTVW